MDTMLFRFLIFLWGMTIFDLQIYPDDHSPWACKGFHLHIIGFEFGWNDESGWYKEFNIFRQEPRLWIEMIFGYKSIFSISLDFYEDVDFSSFSFFNYLYLWNEED